MHGADDRQICDHSNARAEPCKGEGGSQYVPALHKAVGFERASAHRCSSANPNPLSRPPTLDKAYHRYAAPLTQQNWGLSIGGLHEHLNRMLPNTCHPNGPKLSQAIHPAELVKCQKLHLPRIYPNARSQVFSDACCTCRASCAAPWHERKPTLTH